MTALLAARLIMATRRLSRFRLSAPAALAVASLCVATDAIAQLDSCQIQRITLCDGCTVQRRLTVQRDGGCQLQNTVEGAILGVRLVRPPRNGMFGRSNLTLQAYVPKKGYVGEDYFEYELSFEHFGKPARTIIQNIVTVR